MAAREKTTAGLRMAPKQRVHGLRCEGIGNVVRHRLDRAQQRQQALTYPLGIEIAIGSTPAEAAGQTRVRLGGRNDITLGQWGTPRGRV